MLDILIPIGFVIFILYILNTQFGWWKYFVDILDKTWNFIKRQSR